MTKIERIIVSMDGRCVGHAAQAPDGRCTFEYAPEWLDRGFSISPWELPLRPGVTVAGPRPFGGNFGVFDDAMPDGWGLLVLCRYLQQKGIVPSRLTLLEQLAYVGTGGRGALEFHPDWSGTGRGVAADFERLEQEIAAVLRSDDYRGAGIEELWQRGGSPGGARPKVFVEMDGREWLVKFPARYDPPEIGVQEYRYSLLARRCGVEMPETRLFEGRFFGVERFDRAPGGVRHHTVTAAGLLRADYRLPSIDYVHLMALTRELTRDEREVWRMFRLMAFNYLIANKDDHAKNFTFLYRDGAWHLSPAYDLLPSDGIGGFHTTAFADSIEPADADVLRVAEHGGLNPRRAQAVLEEMRAEVEKGL